MDTILQTKDAQLLAIIRMDIVRLSNDPRRLPHYRESLKTIVLPELDRIIRTVEAHPEIFWKNPPHPKGGNHPFLR